MSLNYHQYSVADIDVPSVYLMKGVGAYELMIPVGLKMQSHKDKYELRIDSARAFISSGNVKNQLLGTARPDDFQTYPTFDHSYQGTQDLRLMLQPQQLSAIEDIRNGDDFEVKLEIRGEARLNGEVQRTHDKLTVHIPRSEWVKQLKNIGFMDVLLMEIPFPVAEVPERLETVHHALEEAQRHFANAEYASCVASCRTAIQEIGHHIFDGKDWATGILKRLREGATDMSKMERDSALYAVVRHYTHQAHHGEGEGGSRHYSRSEAQMILRMVAALVSGATSSL